MTTTTLPAGGRATETGPEIVIACATDNGYAMPLGVTINSLLANARPETRFRIYVIASSLTEANAERLRRVAHTRRGAARLTIVEADEAWLREMPLYAHLTAEAYLRFQLPDILPASCDKVLYLDCDLCVLTDLDALWNSDLGDLSLLAALDANVRVVSDPHYGLDNYAALGLDPNLPYFNSGVLLVNLKKWRQEGTGARLLEYVRQNHAVMRLADQDALNAVLAHDWGLLDYKWNANLRALELCDGWPESEFKTQIVRRRAELMRSPAICHFAGDLKPWTPGYYPPMTGTWIRYLLASGWLGAAGAARWLAAWLVTQAIKRARRRARLLLGPRRRPTPAAS